MALPIADQTKCKGWIPPALPFRHPIRNICRAYGPCTLLFPDPILQVVDIRFWDQDGGVVCKLMVSDEKHAMHAIIAPDLHWMPESGHLKKYSTVRLVHYELATSGTKTYLAVMAMQVILPKGHKDEFKNAMEVITLGPPPKVNAVITDAATCTRNNQFLTQDVPIDTQAPMVSFDTIKINAGPRRREYLESLAKCENEPNEDDTPEEAVDLDESRAAQETQSSGSSRVPASERKIAKMRANRFATEEVQSGERKIAKMRGKRRSTQSQEVLEDRGATGSQEDPKVQEAAKSQEGDEAKDTGGAATFWDGESGRRKIGMV